MNLILYKTVDADNVINKTLTDSVTISINLKRDTDLTKPTLILEAIEVGEPPALIDFKSYNYCEISDLGRKYFIRRITAMSNTIFSLELECDYLESYKTAILGSYASYHSKIGVGDYGEVDINATGREIITEIDSDVSLVADTTNNAILSVMRWG